MAKLIKNTAVIIHIFAVQILVQHQTLIEKRKNDVPKFNQNIQYVNTVMLYVLST